jgi:3D (Asp-Asp-Asp) domain-containing protein
MNTRKQILVASLIAISLVTSTTAQAGLLDWFRSNSATAEVARNGSFDSLYASVMNSATPENERPTLIANSVAPVSSPKGGISKTIRQFYMVEVSAYNSEVGQTDDSPFITAKGTHVRDGIVAANMFPFGTAIKIPALYGDKIFVVEDRMNTRYQKNVDIWMESKAEARKLGRRLVQIEVIK